MKKTLLAAIAGTMALLAIGIRTASAGTLDSVRKKGYLQCGVNEGLPGFSISDSKGDWTGLDVDFCRAIAAAIFNDPKKVKFTPLSAEDRFAALQSGKIDILARNTTWTMSRDTQLGLAFSVVNFYTGQGFMVHKKLGITSALQLSGASLCVAKATTSELNVADYFKSHNMKYDLMAFEKTAKVIAAYQVGQCDAYTADRSALFAERLKMKNPDDNVILPEIISQEPLGPVVRQDDPQWFDIVKWTHYAMLEAELYGVTSQNVDTMLKSKNPKIQRLLGVEDDFGKAIGLDRKWAYDIVKDVGNYGQVFDRDVGKGSSLKMQRGLNALWTRGGLQYGMPIR